MGSKNQSTQHTRKPCRIFGNIKRYQRFYSASQILQLYMQLYLSLFFILRCWHEWKNHKYTGIILRSRATLRSQGFPVAIQKWRSLFLDRVDNTKQFSSLHFWWFLVSSDLVYLTTKRWFNPCSINLHVAYIAEPDDKLGRATLLFELCDWTHRYSFPGFSSFILIKRTHGTDNTRHIWLLSYGFSFSGIQKRVFVYILIVLI